MRTRNGLEPNANKDIGWNNYAHAYRAKRGTTENEDSDFPGKHFSIFRLEEIRILDVDTMSLRTIRRSRLAPCPDTGAG